jgi:hypothetical protein
MDATVVLIPMILLHQGMGSSKIMHRQQFLEITFWSLYPFFKNIVGKKAL